jgi:hypothetical protein
MKLGRTLAFAAAASAAALASAQGAPIGPRVGVFFPTDERLRAAFGDAWLSLGIGGVSGREAQARNGSLDWSVTTNKKDGNSIFIGAASWGTKISLGESNTGPFRRQAAAAFQPYFAARAGLSYIDFAFSEGQNRISGKQLGWNGNVELGALVGRNFSLSARYDFNPSYKGTSFSGLFLEANFTVARF